MNPPEKDPAFEALLEYLHLVRGFDFKAYKRSTLMRRVAKRLQTINIESFKDYNVRGSYYGWKKKDKSICCSVPTFAVPLAGEVKA